MSHAVAPGGRASRPRQLRGRQTAPTVESRPRHFLSVLDRSTEELRSLLARALTLKRELKEERRAEPLLAGRVLAIVFQKPSLRTRVSLEVAMLQTGGSALYLSPAEIQLGAREGVQDASQVLSRYVDAIAARVYAHADVVGLAEYASVPVINALSDREHPCQTLADLLTLVEHRGEDLSGLRLAYVGDGNNVASSLALAAPRLGVELRIATPDGHDPPSDILDQARGFSGLGGGGLELFRDPRDAVRGADVVYTDAWYSMGQEDEAELRRPIFAPYQVNEKLLKLAALGALVMHDLPAHRGQEITDEVMDGPRSVIYDQAENRLHAQKALLVELLAGD